jgi:cation diffusion facilitator CzcD-associated flavoprotein CzcO
MPSTDRDRFEAVVVGAGPAGIIAVGNLLEQRIAPILWVDESFAGGRINQAYREVPSNTKVKLFVDFATAIAPFRRIVSGVPSRDRWDDPSASDGVAVGGSAGKGDLLSDVRGLDQEKGCELAHAGDICNILTKGLRRTAGVHSHTGRVNEAVLDSSDGSWKVGFNSSANDTNSDFVQAKRIVLCTGSHPTDQPLPSSLPVQKIDLDTALSPTKLSALLSPLGPTTVGVIGASHSAVLVLMNLTRLALSGKSDLHVKWFTRHPLRYAEYEADFIARDNTGLKGDAAVWARENLEPETLVNSPIKPYITKVAYNKGDEEAVYKEHLGNAEFVVQAVGFTRNALPTLKDGHSGELIEPAFDHDRGVFKHNNGSGDVVPGLFGAGIAYPERVVDRKYGHTEYNVGFFKFMKAVKKWAAAEWK